MGDINRRYKKQGNDCQQFNWGKKMTMKCM